MKHPLVTVLSVGTLKTQWIREGCEQYLLRLTPRVALRSISASRLRDPKKQVEDECLRLMSVLEDFRGRIVLLDERGKSFSSPLLAKDYIGRAQDSGEPILFVLGGAFGFTDAFRAGRSLLQFSSMVFPHELCHVLLLEQIFRAFEILKGSGYHHGSE